MIRRLIILLLIVGCGIEPEDDAGVAGGTAVEDEEVILHPIVGVWDVEKIAYQSIDISDNELAGFFHPSHKTLTFTFLEGDELIEDWCYEDEIDICYAKNYKYSIVDEKLDTLKLIQTTFPPEYWTHYGVTDFGVRNYSLIEDTLKFYQRLLVMIVIMWIFVGGIWSHIEEILTNSP